MRPNGPLANNCWLLSRSGSPRRGGGRHSGTRTDRSPELGGYYFAGHLQIAATIADIKAHPAGGVPPTHFLISGSSAGGIGALTHTDFFGEQFEGAVVKGAPECGFFYPNVTSVPDLAAGRQTPLLLLGQQADWHPYQPTGCRTAAALSSLSAEARSLHCTNAHTLFPHLRRPLFFRENQFDISKLGNCGWRPDNREYLVRWGEWMRSQLATVRASSVDHVRAGLCDLCRDVWRVGCRG